MKQGYLSKETINFQMGDVDLRLSAMHRGGSRPPVVYLHGFGSTKEDFADVGLNPKFADRPLIAFDAPGCGASECSDLSVLSIPFLRKTAMRVLRHYNVDQFHLVGHSMGGLTALMLASDNPSVLSFTDIEGNLAPEDCFLSRRIFDRPNDDPQAFMDYFFEQAWRSDVFSHPLFASALRHKVKAEAVGPIFHSMVDLSDNGGLMAEFFRLDCPKMFVYGDQNRGLSYLDTLQQKGVQLAEIQQSGHWPMYANPPALWARLAQFIDRSEMGMMHD